MAGPYTPNRWLLAAERHQAGLLSALTRCSEGEGGTPPHPK